jgi:hypothetical protein
MFLDSDFLWFIGNIPALSDFSQIFAQVLDRSSPLLESFAIIRNVTLPSSLQDWKSAQSADPDCLVSIDPDSRLLQWAPRLTRSRFSIPHHGSARPPRTPYPPTPHRPTPPCPRQGTYLPRQALLLAIHAFGHSSLVGGLCRLRE